MRALFTEFNRVLHLIIVALVAASLLTSCGGGAGSGGSSTPPPADCSIGGTVSGLASGDSVQLQDNGSDTLTVTADGSFTFATKLASGSAYSVTVWAQPMSPAQTCTVKNGSGTVTASVTNVAVSCVTNTYSIGGTVSGLASGDSVQLQDNGSDTLTVTANGSFTFATPLETGSTYNVTVSAQPTSPAQTCTVTNGSGTVTANVTNVSVFCPGLWTWMSGSNVGYQPGTYGTEGTAAPGNVPGGRETAVAWTDTSGNFWLFGGWGLDSTGNGWWYLNDLWKYSSGQWTWMSGSNLVSQAGTYGTEGTAAPGNVPGARAYAVSWTDTSGNFWLFGGEGYDSSWTLGYLNDLWKYSSGGTQANEWTWMGGSSTVPGANEGRAGVYGTLGNAAPTNMPGGRTAAAAWTDTNGNFWLFGGSGYDSAGNPGNLNDLWKYAPSTGEWTWVGGSSTVPVCIADCENPGVYGTLGQPAATNIPGGRSGAVTWTDATGNLWLFGGSGADGFGNGGILNDLWKYTPSTGEWTWMGGSNDVGLSGAVDGVYGTLGMPAAGNVPGSRDLSVSWLDSNGNLWLLGGWFAYGGYEWGDCNDLWEYTPANGEWTWMGGTQVPLVYSSVGVYGTLGQPSPNNTPGARYSAVGWTDANGDLWLFGGCGLSSNVTGGLLNDLWEYKP
jgi:hypothetical protein